MTTLAKISGSLVILAAFCTPAAADHRSDRRYDHDRRDVAVTIGNVFSLIAHDHDHGRNRFDRGHMHDHPARHGKHKHGRFDWDHRHHDHGGRPPAPRFRERDRGFQFHLVLGDSGFARPLHPIGAPHEVNPQPILPPLPDDAPTLGGFCVGSMVHSAMPLYHAVKIRDPHEIAPHSVRRVIAVRDPRGCDHHCDCCPQRCVFVEVCLPCCACSKIDVSDHGRRIKYDFGKYDIEITSRDGVVTVDYDD